MSYYLTWLVITTAIVVGSIPQPGRREITSRHLDKLVRRHRLPLPAGLKMPLTRRLAASDDARRRGGMVGLGVGAGLGLVVVLIGHQSLSSSLIMLPALIGLAAGEASGASRLHADQAGTVPRVAHTRATSLADYTTRGEHGAAHLSIAALALSGLATVALWSLAPVRMPALWLAMPLAVTAVGLALLLLLVRSLQRVVDRPQQATSELELAWDDALRAHSVREVLDMVTITGLTMVMITLLQMAPWVTWLDGPEAQRSVAWTVAPGGLIVAAAAWLIVGVTWATGRTRRNPTQDTLWAGHQFTQETARAER